MYSKTKKRNIQNRALLIGIFLLVGLLIIPLSQIGQAQEIEGRKGMNAVDVRRTDLRDDDANGPGLELGRSNRLNKPELIDSIPPSGPDIAKSISKRSARTGRNPQTGKEIQ